MNKILLDSVNYKGDRLTTFQLKFPKFILAEFNTHRFLSRNAKSSRALRISVLIQEVEDSPFIPTVWGKNQKGMKAEDYFVGTERKRCITLWKRAAKNMVRIAKEYEKIGVHKQTVNRLLEPFSYVTVLASATDWGNFFNLRIHEDAQPEFHELAYEMLTLYNESEPKQLAPGEWHIPFRDKMPDGVISLDQQLAVATARCARVSYNTHDGDFSLEKDMELFNNLLQNGHMSPFEHSAECLDQSIRVGNFVGWKQFRKHFSGENRSFFDAKKILREKRPQWYKKK